jgi:hypothetical protein
MVHCGPTNDYLKCNEPLNRIGFFKSCNEVVPRIVTIVLTVKPQLVNGLSLIPILRPEFTPFVTLSVDRCLFLVYIKLMCCDTWCEMMCASFQIKLVLSQLKRYLLACIVPNLRFANSHRCREMLASLIQPALWID